MGRPVWSHTPLPPPDVNDPTIPPPYKRQKHYETPRKAAVQAIVAWEDH
jgi:hypothetical protein